MGAVEEAWAKLQRDWDNAEAHRRFIVLCSSHEALAEASRLYRSVRDADPGRSEEAKRCLDAVKLAALEQLSRARRRTPANKRSRTMWLMVGACGFVVVYALLTLLRVRSQ